jgi:hypothetical protein
MDKKADKSRAPGNSSIIYCARSGIVPRTLASYSVNLLYVRRSNSENPNILFLAGGDQAFTGI